MSRDEKEIEQPDEEVVEEQQPADPMETLRRERDDFESKYLRSAADLQNYMRRSHQNLADAREQQVMEIVRALLAILDHFDHALGVDTETSDADAVLQGVQIVRDEFLSTLERFGVQRIEAKRGDAFDPNRHEAVMREAVEGLESDHVANQNQPGYVLGEQTLRPAKVSITQ